MPQSTVLLHVVLHKQVCSLPDVDGYSVVAQHSPTSSLASLPIASADIHAARQAEPMKKALTNA